MKFVFNYEETLSRRVTVNAENLHDAINEIVKQIDDEKIVLGAEDFIAGQISMPLKDNFLPHLTMYGNKVENTEDMEIVIDYW